MSKCAICGAEQKEAFRATVLKKYEAVYNQCGECGFLQVENPYWLEEAYSDAIATADTGLVQRNFSIARELASLLYFGMDSTGTYVDVAGGYGMLVRLMRDFGFDFFWDDKYCQNLLAKGYESTNASGPISALTAFEVLEHLVDPVDFVAEQLKKFNTKTLIFTTELYSGNEAPSKDWWYFAFPTGQHISFFQKKTLQKIAEKLGTRYYQIGGMHIFSDVPLKNYPIIKFAGNRLLMLMSMYVQRRMDSKIMTDHYMQLEK
jgi:hypothetical protein